MIIVTLFYIEECHVANSAGELALADLQGWRIRENEVRSANNPGSKVHQILTLVPIMGGYVDNCPANLILALMTIALKRWGGIFALETRVGES